MNREKSIKIVVPSNLYNNVLKDIKTMLALKEYKYKTTVIKDEILILDEVEE